MLRIQVLEMGESSSAGSAALPFPEMFLPRAGYELVTL